MWVASCFGLVDCLHMHACEVFGVGSWCYVRIVVVGGWVREGRGEAFLRIARRRNTQYTIAQKYTKLQLLFTIFVPLIFVGCQSTVDQLTISTCKAVETNVAKCNQLIAEDISDKNANRLSSVNEGEL